MTQKEQKEAERQEALAELRAILKPGATVYAMLRHVSASGMSRSISLMVPMRDKDRHGKLVWIVRGLDHLTAAALDMKVDHAHGGVKIGGAGMDMGLALVSHLSTTLYPKREKPLRHEWL